MLYRKSVGKSLHSKVMEEVRDKNGDMFVLLEQQLIRSSTLMDTKPLRTS